LRKGYLGSGGDKLRPGDILLFSGPGTVPARVHEPFPEEVLFCGIWALRQLAGSGLKKGLDIQAGL